MTTVILGANQFIDCESIVSLRQHALLKVAVNPLRITLSTPPDLPSKRLVQVINNQPHMSSLSEVRIVKNVESVAIFWSQTPLLTATLLDPDTVSIRVDLRPLGINLHDDGGTLHVGTSEFSGNRFANSKIAIALG